MSTSNNNEERAVFASTILVESSPVEASNIFLSRLLESKGLNNQIGSFLFDYMMINRHYASKLRKILDTKGKNLNQSIDQYIKKETKHDAKYAAAKPLGADHLGQFGDLWTGVIDDIKEEIYITEMFCNNMEKQLISPLKKCFDINKNKKYSNMLDTVLELSKTAEAVVDLPEADVGGAAEEEESHKFSLKGHHHKKSSLIANNDEWAIKSPQVSEQFESFEFNRLLFLKDVFISFQNNSNFRFNENLKHNENLFSVLVGFNPDDEIARFAEQSVKNDAGKPVKPLPPISKNTDDDVNFISTPPMTKKKSTTNANAKPSETLDTASHNNDFQPPPLQPQRSNPSTISSQVTEKRRSGLRSKMGTLFGKKKNKQKHPHQDFATTKSIVEDERVAETAPPAMASDNQPIVVKDNEKVAAPPAPPAPGPSSEPATTPLQEKTIEPRSSFMNVKKESSKAEEEMSINQRPLVPNVRSDSANSVTEPSSNNNALPPPPPPTRKVGTEHPQQPPVKKDRRDIQSTLFTNLTAADIMEQGRGGNNNNNSNNRLSLIGEEQPMSSVPPPLPKNASYSISEASKKHDSVFGSHHGSVTSLAQSQITTTKTGNKFTHPELNQRGLNASVSESIKVSIRDGFTENCQIIGEVAMTYFADQMASSPPPPQSYLKLIDSQNVIEKLIPNHSFLEAIDVEGLPVSEKCFKQNLSQISNRTLGGLKYLVSSADSPIVILPIWRFEPHQASCMIGIKLSDSVLAKLGDDDLVQLDDFVLSIALEDGVEIQSAMSRPSGTFNKEKRRITWKYTEPIVLSKTHGEDKIVARFMTNGIAKESKNGAQAKFVINNGKGGDKVVSNIALEYCNELGDHQQWERVNVAKTFSTNVFTAHSV
ncbi:Syp1 protein [Saccharomycopsis crataegensis]|uniref:Syp1 protein n=1 Tax=Saccharomycopsis crataegensis TaxID=43959 RepID=A0AAV5QK43_9ASCO|nr:Syp1 protein [Saccharomycopsis crataegensis]